MEIREVQAKGTGVKAQGPPAAHPRIKDLGDDGSLDPEKRDLSKHKFEFNRDYGGKFDVPLVKLRHGVSHLLYAAKGSDESLGYADPAQQSTYLVGKINKYLVGCFQSGPSERGEQDNIHAEHKLILALKAIWADLKREAIVKDGSTPVLVVKLTKSPCKDCGPRLLLFAQKYGVQVLVKAAALFHGDSKADVLRTLEELATARIYVRPWQIAEKLGKSRKGGLQHELGLIEKDKVDPEKIKKLRTHAQELGQSVAKDAETLDKLVAAYRKLKAEAMPPIDPGVVHKKIKMQGEITQLEKDKKRMSIELAQSPLLLPIFAKPAEGASQEEKDRKLQERLDLAFKGQDAKSQLETMSQLTSLQYVTDTVMSDAQKLVPQSPRSSRLVEKQQKEALDKAAQLKEVNAELKRKRSELGELEPKAKGDGPKGDGGSSA